MRALVTKRDERCMVAFLVTFHRFLQLHLMLLVLLQAQTLLVVNESSMNRQVPIKVITAQS